MADMLVGESKALQHDMTQHQPIKWVHAALQRVVSRPTFFDSPPGEGLDEDGPCPWSWKDRWG